jgi:hypothetical protein
MVLLAPSMGTCVAVVPDESNWKSIPPAPDHDSMISAILFTSHTVWFHMLLFRSVCGFVTCASMEYWIGPAWWNWKRYSHNEPRFYDFRTSLYLAHCWISSIFTLRSVCGFASDNGQWISWDCIGMLRISQKKLWIVCKQSWSEGGYSKETRRQRPITQLRKTRLSEENRYEEKKLSAYNKFHQRCLVEPTSLSDGASGLKAKKNSGKIGNSLWYIWSFKDDHMGIGTCW